MAEQEGSIVRVPLQSLDTYDGVVAEDVISQEGALLLPQGLRLSLLGSSLPKVLDRLRSSGVEGISIRTETSVSLKSVDSFLEVVLAQNQAVIDREVSREAVSQVQGLFQSVRRQPMTPELLVPLVATGKTLAQEILKNPQVLLSLARVHRWDEYTFVHSFNVAALAGFLAQRLHPQEPDLVEQIVLGGLLHDLGKAQVPLEVLNKPGPLDDREFALMKQHSAWGEELALQGEVTSPPIRAVIRWHHERWTGCGYPDGLRREEIPEAARITAVADVFDALTAERAYKQSLPSRDAMNLILGDTGQHFDPRASRTLLTSFGLYPPGSIVELSDRSVGVVVSAGGEDLIRPVVLIQVTPEGTAPESPLFRDLRRCDLRIRNYLGSGARRDL